jgi:serine phosphatase RsbU (regulator of sigma subunit)
MSSPEDRRVRALEELGVLDTPPEERFDRITRVARELFGVDSALISLIADDRQWVKSPQAPGAQSAPRADALCDVAIRTPRTLVVPDAPADPRFAANPHVVRGLRFYAGHPLEAGGHRVGTLCLLGDRPREFTERERARLELLARWAEVELQNRAELDRAAQVQRALHPHATTLRVPGYDLAGVSLPARAVGGDLLDWYRAPGGDVVLTLGDVMGKGTGAAIMMAGVRAALRTAGLGPSPAATVLDAAGALEEDLAQTGILVTLALARLVPDTGALTLVDAGHNLTALVRADGRVTVPESGGLPLGVLPDGDWVDQPDVLEPGDTLVTFSDGLLDLYDGTAPTTVEALAGMVRGCRDARSVVDRVAALARRADRPDDVTVAVLRRLGARPAGGRGGAR